MGERVRKRSEKYKINGVVDKRCVSYKCMYVYEYMYLYIMIERETDLVDLFKLI